MCFQHFVSVIHNSMTLSVLMTLAISYDMMTEFGGRSVVILLLTCILRTLCHYSAMLWSCAESTHCLLSKFL